jgi:hypothetical protein
MEVAFMGSIDEVLTWTAQLEKDIDTEVLKWTAQLEKDIDALVNYLNKPIMIQFERILHTLDGDTLPDLNKILQDIDSLFRDPLPASGGAPPSKIDLMLTDMSNTFRLLYTALTNINKQLPQIDLMLPTIQSVLQDVGSLFRDPLPAPGGAPPSKIDLILGDMSAIFRLLYTTLRNINNDQPKVDSILDSSQGILSRINDTIGKALGFINNYRFWVKIGLGISGFAIVVTLILIPVLLIRIILFGL